MNEDKYIKFLRILKERLENNEPIDEIELSRICQDLKIDFGIQGDLKYAVFAKNEITRRHSGVARYFMTLDAYLKLLQYEELSQAREDSKQARKEAKTATIVAIFAIGVSILIAIVQIIVSLIDK